MKSICNSGHDSLWTNSETVGNGKWKIGVVNLKIMVYAFLTGMTWDKLQVY